MKERVVTNGTHYVVQHLRPVTEMLAVAALSGDAALLDTLDRTAGVPSSTIAGSLTRFRWLIDSC